MRAFGGGRSLLSVDSLLVATILWLPLPLGSNRPWAWYLAALLACIMLIAARRRLLDLYEAAKRSTDPRWFLAAAGLFVLLPLVQLLPWPDVVLAYVAPGIADAHREAATLLGHVPSAATLDRQATLDEFLRRSAYLAFMLIAAAVAVRRGGLELIARAVVYAALINAIYGIANYLTHGEFLFFKPAMHDYLNVVSGTYVNKNHFAGLMELALPIAVYMVIGSASHSAHAEATQVYRLLKRGRFVGGVATVAVLVTALLLTVSRGGILAMAVASVIGWALFSRRHSGVRVLRYLLPIAVGVVAFVLLLGFHDILRMFAARGLAVGERADLWLNSLQAFPHYWLLGGGAGAYEALFALFKEPVLGVAIYDHTHNDYIEYLLTSGPLGLLAFVALIGFGLQGLNRRRLMALHKSTSGHAATGMLVGAFALCLHGVVDFNFQIPANAALFFMLLGVGLSAYLRHHVPSAGRVDVK